MMKTLTLLFVCFIGHSVFAQNTVGVLSYDQSRALDGYNLFYPSQQTSVFLINNCGQIVNEWTDEQGTRPGFSSKISEDGLLIKAKADTSVDNFFGAGGSGGVLEGRDWNNEVVWRYVESDSIYRQHHDFEIMPNGNILFISWKRVFLEDLVALGFDTLTNTIDNLWFDCVKEYNPTLDSIVWEWCSDNHTIQELNPSLDNYGLISENPDRININYQEFSFARADWMHGNAVAYNQELDQIALCIRNFNEVWIIDHSTSSLEATQSSGGLSNKGGRILHRWGNPKAYNQGDSLDRKLFYPHNVKWINDPSSQYHNEILLYNNVIDFGLSLGAMYQTPMDSDGSYLIEEGRFLPNEFTRSISHPDTINNFSGQGSNINLLPNGNFFMHASNRGTAFELTDDEEVVWQYVIPLAFGQPVPQGIALDPGDNTNFSMTKYPADYPGFDSKDLSPQAYLELMPNTEFCLLDNIQSVVSGHINVYPNPARDYLNLELSVNGVDIKIFDLNGKCLKHLKSNSLKFEIDIRDLEQGIYFLQAEDQVMKIIVK